MADMSSCANHNLYTNVSALSYSTVLLSDKLSFVALLRGCLEPNIHRICCILTPSLTFYFPQECQMPYEPPRNKPTMWLCAKHPPSLIRAFADAQPDLNLRWAHSHIVWLCYEAAHILMAAHIMIDFVRS